MKFSEKGKGIKGIAYGKDKKKKNRTKVTAHGDKQHEKIKTNYSTP